MVDPSYLFRSAIRTGQIMGWSMCCLGWGWLQGDSIFVVAQSCKHSAIKSLVYTLLLDKIQAVHGALREWVFSTGTTTNFELTIPRTEGWITWLLQCSMSYDVIIRPFHSPIGPVWQCLFLCLCGCMEVRGGFQLQPYDALRGSLLPRHHNWQRIRKWSVVDHLIISRVMNGANRVFDWPAVSCRKVPCPGSPQNPQSNQPMPD